MSGRRSGNSSTALEVVKGGAPVSISEWREAVKELDSEQLSEALAELEQFLFEDIGWRRLGANMDWEFSNQGLMEIIKFSRFMFLKNPLINHATLIQTAYTWGQGVEFSAPGTAGEVVQGTLEDPRNLAAMTSHQNQMLLDSQQATDGNLFVSMFTNPLTGRVIFRVLDTFEILAGDIITNPNDRFEVWYYKRVWTERIQRNGEENPQVVDRCAYYPDWRYRPPLRPQTYGPKNDPVFWDAPVYHIKTGGLYSMRFGIPEMYSALDWARAVKEDMEAYMAMRKALMRYAWQLSVRGGKKGVSAARRRLESTASFESPTESNPPAGPAATFIRGQEAAELQPLRTSGAAPSPDEGRRVGLMVSAGTGIPETILFGDADVGNLATAETLDRPTELQMRNRQQLWSDSYKDMLGYAILSNLKAPNGRLNGNIELDEFDREIPILSEVDDEGKPIKPSVSTKFPDVVERNTQQRIGAIVDAATLMGRSPAGTMPDKTMVELMLRALQVEDINSILDDLFPDGATMLPQSAEVVAGDAGAEPGDANFSNNGQPDLAPGVPGSQRPDPNIEEAARELRDAVARAIRS